MPGNRNANVAARSDEGITVRKPTISDDGTIGDTATSDPYGSRTEKTHGTTEKSEDADVVATAISEMKLAQAPQLVDDSWVEDWDMTVVRCGACKRPFVTKERLADHMRVWHSFGSPRLEPYGKLSPSSADFDDDQIVTIVKGGDLFIEVAVPDDCRFPDGYIPPYKIRFQVVASALWMTSRVFYSMFGPKSPFQEALNLRRSHISGLGLPPAVVTLDDDRDALEYIFKVLHHRLELLPVADKSLMVEVAAVCDKYELHSAIQHIADKYFLSRAQSASDGYSDWLFIAYVFGYDDVFTKASLELILSEENPISTISIYTPQKVTEMLVTRRETAVEKLVQQLKSIEEQRTIKPGATRPVTTCKSNSTQCEFLQYGHLVGTLTRYQLSEKIPSTSLRQISNEVAAIQSVDSCLTTACDSCGYKGNHTTNKHPTCSWVSEFKPFVRTLVDSVEGLKLSDFASSKRDHK